MNDGSTDETWRAIPGYDGWYEVSDLGRVRSWKRHPGKTGRLSRLAEPRILTPAIGSAGRLQISLTGDRLKTWKIHRLVAVTFLGPRPEGQEECLGLPPRWRHLVAPSFVLGGRGPRSPDPI